MIQNTSQSPVMPAVQNKRGSRLLWHEAVMAYLFVSPAMILFLIFTVLPVVFAFLLSFTNYDILSPIKWVGLRNYARLLTDTIFQRGILNVLFYALMFIPSMIILSILLALALNRKVPGMRFFRTLYYLPAVTSSIAASVVWTWMLQKDYGVINQFLALFGIVGPAWLADSDTAMFAIVIVTLWQGLGGNIIIFLAGLQGIPPALYEAAKLDGANGWHLFQYVTLPLLRTTTYLIAFLTLIGSLQLFDQAYAMTQGGPGYATTTAVYQIYSNGFNQLKMGYASAQAFVLALAILILSVIQMRLNRDQAVY
jgi:multiple sugar transport system permease protein